MTLRAVYVDFGGVLVRTEDPAPRARLAQSLGVGEGEIEKIVFENESSAKASLGLMTEEGHWLAVAQTLGLPEGEIPRLREEFFRGDRVDRDLLDFLRRLRKTVKVGLISNAWTGLRAWIVSQHLEDAFDAMIISAEVGVAKPERRIYELALEKLGVAPREAVFVDDMPANAAGARAVGMHAIQFTQPKEMMAELEQLLAVQP
jgi:putative hydrolase of the HAD superfamily